MSSVRFVMSGAAPLSAELTEQLIKVLPNASISQAYGMTESCTTLTFPRLDMKICTLGSSGVLLPGVTAKVVKEDGTLAGFDEQGELFVKAPSLALGYYKNPEATKESFGDGWLRTGDEVVINKDYETFVVDRRKEIFKVKGFQGQCTALFHGPPKSLTRMMRSRARRVGRTFTEPPRHHRHVRRRCPRRVLRRSAPRIRRTILRCARSYQEGSRTDGKDQSRDHQGPSPTFSSPYCPGC